ncbi:hypothetical protein C2845_PM17G03920 [Panicum miliaceum]|uniref:Uncharacterized protein n=1 Tax=Panicum miliaceum TaxID=4540 RepID=A0A3L6Q1U8_PANMI|nr:hypothetical protein C2845_PM17G03920 [Panicum miliaceum]
MAEIGNVGAGEEVVDDSAPQVAADGKAASDGQLAAEEIPMPAPEDVEEEFDFDPFAGEAGEDGKNSGSAECNRRGGWREEGLVY